MKGAICPSVFGPRSLQTDNRNASGPKCIFAAPSSPPRASNLLALANAGAPFDQPCGAASAQEKGAAMAEQVDPVRAVGLLEGEQQGQLSQMLLREWGVAPSWEIEEREEENEQNEQQKEPLHEQQETESDALPQGFAAGSDPLFGHFCLDLADASVVHAIEQRSGLLELPSPVAAVSYVLVDEPLRGQGYGRRLVRAFLQAVRLHPCGFRSVLLSCRSHLFPFYQGCGGFIPLDIIDENATLAGDSPEQVFWMYLIFPTTA